MSEVNPFFSIVIPTYNRGHMIKDTIDRVLLQDLSSYEIIIVDDGSKDNTRELISSAYSNESKVRYFFQENKERGAARNNGFKNARGTYVIFFDSDDRMHSDHLSVLKEKIDKYQPEFIATKFRMQDETGKYYSSSINSLPEGYYDYKIFLSGNPLACNFCVRKNEKIFLFEEDRSLAIKEDWLFLMKNLRNEKLYLIDKVTITLFDHTDRSMRSDNSIIIQKTLLAEEWILNNVTLSEKEQAMLKGHVYYFCGIHSYIDGKRKEAISYIYSAIKSVGIKKKYLALLIKSLIGRALLSKLK